MIADVILIFIGSILQLLGTAMGFVSWVLPDAVTNAFEQLAAYTVLLTPIFPVATFWAALGTLLTFIGLLYAVKVTLFVYARLPVIGKGH